MSPEVFLVESSLNLAGFVIYALRCQRDFASQWDARAIQTSFLSRKRTP